MQGLSCDLENKTLARRTYNQACPLAFALDLVGDRWTLLIVRDLLLGPLRFSDLLERLPGIAKSMLAERLRYLVTEQLIRQRKMPPPAASTVYELTPAGRALQPALMALAGWSMQFRVGDIPADGHGASDLVGFGLEMCFQPERAGDTSVVHAFRCDDADFFATIADGEIAVRRGRPTSPASFELSASRPLFGALLATRTVQSSNPDLTLLGTSEAIRDGLSLYGITVE